MTVRAPHAFSAEITGEQRSQALRRVVWATMITATVLLTLQILEDPSTARRRLLSIAFTDAFGFLALWLDRRGRTGLAGGVFIASLIFIITWRAWTLGGLDAPVTAGYVVMVGMAGLLLGRIAGAMMAALAASLTLGLIFAKVYGWLPPQQLQFTPLGLWLSNCIWVALAFSLQGQIAASFRVALARTERELEQRTRADREREASDRASRAKTVFLANMSHELRTPLTAVLGHAQLLQRTPDLGEHHRRSVDAILSSGTHLLALINDVLEASKMEAGRTELAAEPMDLHATLADIEHMFTALTRAKRLTLSFERAADVPRAIRGDVAKVRQVLINLVGNAVKFTERGSVHVRTTAAGARISIAVSDTGPGVPESDRARIFVAFEQADRSARAGGTGLGLTISQSVARMMQGDVTLDSRADSGSTFTFTFAAEPVPLSELPSITIARDDLPLALERYLFAPAPSPSALALAPLLAKLPHRLRAELREAALQARTTRLEQLTQQAATIAPDAAEALTPLIENFRYDDLITALDGLALPAHP